MRLFAAGDGFTTFLLWVVLLGSVALVALTATWYLGSLAADALLNTATRYVQCAVGVVCRGWVGAVFSGWVGGAAVEVALKAVWWRFLAGGGA